MLHKVNLLRPVVLVLFLYALTGCTSDSGEQGDDQIAPAAQIQTYEIQSADFESNGDLISGWYWLRDRALEDYAQWTLYDLPEGLTSIDVDITALATNTSGGDRGYDAHFLLYYGAGDRAETAEDAVTARDSYREQRGDLETDQSPNFIIVDLNNISPLDDPVGYTCQGTVTIPLDILQHSDSLILMAMREAVTDNHVAFNADSISTTITSSGSQTGSDDEAEDQTWNEGENNDGSGHNYGDLTGDEGEGQQAEEVDSDGDGIQDEDEALYGTGVNDSDSDDDGVIDGEDLSPLLNPGEPDLLSLQKVGMIRIEQPIKAYGLDGWVEYWNKDIKYACKWGICVPIGSQLVLKATYEDTYVKNSTMTQTEYKKAINRVFEEENFVAYKMENIAPSDIAVEDVELTHDLDSERSLTYPSSLLAPNEYRFYYDDLTDYQIAYLKNDTEIKYPNEDEYFQYYLYPVKIQTNKENSFSIQYKDSSVYQTLTYTDDEHYKVPGFMYAFYSSDNFNSDTNLPYKDGLSIAMIEREGQFMATLRLPPEQATHGTSYLKITPVWIEKNGSQTNYIPLDPNWDITGISRDIVYLKDDDGNSQVVSEEFSSFAGWNTTPKSLSSFTSNQNSSGYDSKEEWMGIIKKDPNDEDDLYTIMDVMQTVITYADIGQNAFDTAASYTESFVQAANGVDDLDDLPDGHWAKSATYSNATSVVSAAGGIITLVTNGQEAWSAYKDGDYVDVAYYSFQAAGGALDTATAMVEIAETSFGYAGKATKLSKLGTKKAAAGIAVAVGVVEVTYDIYKYSETNDPILKTMYAENIAADAIDTGISVAAVFSPHTAVFQLTWTAEAEIYALIFGEDFAYQVAHSPGSAAVFLGQYFFSETIPSVMSTTAYNDARGGTEDDQNGILDEIAAFNAVPLSYMSIFIDPDLD